MISFFLLSPPTAGCQPPAAWPSASLKSPSDLFPSPPSAQPAFVPSSLAQQLRLPAHSPCKSKAARGSAVTGVGIRECGTGLCAWALLCAVQGWALGLVICHESGRRRAACRMPAVASASVPPGWPNKPRFARGPEFCQIHDSVQGANIQVWYAAFAPYFYVAVGAITAVSPACWQPTSRTRRDNAGAQMHDAAMSIGLTSQGAVARLRPPSAAAAATSACHCVCRRAARPRPQAKMDPAVSWIADSLDYEPLPVPTRMAAAQQQKAAQRRFGCASGDCCCGRLTASSFVPCTHK